MEPHKRWKFVPPTPQEQAEIDARVGEYQKMLNDLCLACQEPLNGATTCGACGKNQTRVASGMLLNARARGALTVRMGRPTTTPNPATPS